MNQVATLPKRSLVDSMAAKYDMEPAAFVNAIKATVIKGQCSNEQFAAFLMVAKEYDLNPLTKEIYAFPDRGGITPIVSIDGWMNLINSHPQFDGMEFVDTTGDDGKLYSVECKMYRKDRQRPTTVIEYMTECFRQTDPWKKWPNRMLRHKAAIQCARYAFGFSGIMEPDEYERMKDVTPVKDGPVFDPFSDEPVTATQQPQERREGFDASFTREEPHDALTGEILDTDSDDTGPPPGPSDAGDGSPAESPASEEADSPPPSASSTPSRDPETNVLIQFARDVLPRSADPKTQINVLNGIEKRWMAQIEQMSPEVQAKAEVIAKSMRAIFNKKTSLESAASYFADVLDTTEAAITGKEDA